jgi:hypothetical protein
MPLHYMVQAENSRLRIKDAATQHEACPCNSLAVFLPPEKINRERIEA